MAGQPGTNTLKRNMIVIVFLFTTAFTSIGGGSQCEARPADSLLVARIDSLLRVSQSLDANGNYDSALAVCRVAFDAAAGQEGLPDTLKARCNLQMSSSFARMRDADSAGFYATTAYEIIMASSTRTDSLLAQYLIVLGRVNRLQEKYDEAKAVLTQALEIVQSIYGDSDFRLVEILVDLGHIDFYTGDYEGALPLYQRALNILDHKNVEDYESLPFLYFNFAQTNSELRNFETSERYYLKARDLFKQSPEKYGYWLAHLQAYLGQTYFDWGHLQQSYEAYQIALDLFNKLPGDYDEFKGTITSMLAIINSTYSRYAEAEENYKSTIMYFTRIYGADDIEVARQIRNLSSLYDDIGDIDKARALNEWALDVYVREMGPDDPRLAPVLNGLGWIYTESGEFNRADSLLNRALALSIATYPPDDISLTFNYLSLGNLYRDWGKYDLAEKNYRECKRIYELAGRGDSLSSYYHNVAFPLLGLGDIYYYQGRYDMAEACLDSAIDLWLPVFGTDDEGVVDCLEGLTRVYASEGRISECLKTIEQVQQRRFRFLQYAFDNSSEDRKLVYLRKFPTMNKTLLSLAYSHDSKEVRSDALQMLCAAKSAVLDALCKDQDVIFCNNDPDLQEKVGRLNETSRLYSSLYWSDEDKDSSVIDSLAVLYDVIDSLETALSRGCREFRNQTLSRIPEIADLTEALPENTVYCDFVRFKPFDFDRTGTIGERTDPARYMAFTLDKSGIVSSCDLGDASIIDSLINVLRANVDNARNVIYTSRAEAGEREFQRLSRELYDIVVAPLEKHFAEAANLIICPDGLLNLIPFEILYTQDGQYLIEKYGLSYVSSGRELLQFGDEPSTIRNAVVMGDPDFNYQSGVISLENSADDVDRTFAEAFPGMLPLRNAGDCFQREFAAMPGTREELQLVTQELESVDSISVEQFSGIAADEKTLRDISAPDVLHLATHGFFCGEGEDGSTASFANPLLRSGLAMAGANENRDRENHPGEDTDDGLLTAFEVATLNLVGTDLVVLSACETGLGEITGGEGVFGLRRAFQRAGAKSIVMSLFAVLDESTSDQMERFYRNWLAGQTKTAALRNASLSILNERRSASQSTHPLFWGGFILTGDPD